MLKNLQKLLSISKYAIVLILLGTVVWSITMVKSGIEYNYGMGFWGPNGHDGVWHIALAESLSRGSLEMPIMAGEQIQNYHIGFDLALAGINRISGIPITILYFQILPPIIALALGILVYRFVKKWSNSETASLWALFFTYFGGNPGWIITLLKDGTLGGESMFWAQQSALTLINPPFAFSLVILMTGLFVLNKSKRPIIPVICFGSLVAIKAYAGVLVLGGLLLAGIYEYIRDKKFKYLKIFIASFIISLILFLPFNNGSSNLFVWKPAWFLETMLGFSDRLGWTRFYEAMTNYRLGLSIKLVPAYLVAFIIFIIGNFWTRVLGVFAIRKFQPLEVLLGSMILGAVVFPMLFLQEGTPWNTVQFLYYALFLSGLFAGITLAQKRFKSVVIGLVVIAFTLPTTYATLKHYLPQRPPAKLSTQELAALSFLRSLPGGVVLTYPFDKDNAKAAESNPPRPLYLYETTSYVAALGGKQTFLEDEVNLNIMGYNWQERREALELFYKSQDSQSAYSFLRENNIKYIYWVGGQRATLGETQLGIKQIFENAETRIYEVSEQ